MRARAVLLFLALSFAGTACAGNQAYLEWRPGMTEIAFDGLFEIPLAEFEGFAAAAEPNTVLDRAHGRTRPDAAATLTELAGLIQATSDADPRGLAILSLDAEGNVGLAAGQGRTEPGTVDWLAVTPDRQHAALLSGTKLAVAIAGATTGIDVGTLIGNSIDRQQMLMLVREDEMTVFVLPELGGVVSANQPGYLFEFEHHPGAREPWSVSVARVAVKL